MTKLAEQLLETCAGGLAEHVVTVIRALFPLALAVYAFGSQVQGSAHA